MDIESELKNLERERALKIINDVLKHFSTSSKTLAIAGAWTSLIGEEPALVHLIAPPESDCYQDQADRLNFLDDGCEVGYCHQCEVQLWSSFKHVLCPLCGTPCFAS